MDKTDRSGAWERFARAANAEGLSIRWIVARERVDPVFASGPKNSMRLTPAQLYPDYRYAILLGSGGARFWNRFRKSAGKIPSGGPGGDDPLDRHCERHIEPLLSILREDDPSAIAVYPFAHARQIVPFMGFLGSLKFLAPSPLGLSIDPEHGPWFAWRGAILTAAEYPESAFPAEPVCASCAAPCQAACPVGAVRREGFRWRDCAEFRLRPESPCAERCLAREACPIGPASRYPEDEIRYHYRASLRMIRQASEPRGP